MTSAFVDAAEVMAVALGLPGYGFAVVGHPVASRTDAQLAASARGALEQAAQLLGLASTRR